MMTPKKAVFAKEYLVDLNATQAAIRAGYSAKTAKSQGQRLLTDVDVQAAVQVAMKARSERTQITADRVIQELAALGFSDTTKAIQIVNGRVKVADTTTLDGDTRRAISEIRETVSEGGRSIAIKFHDKRGSLELLGKHLGIFREAPEGSDTPAPIKVEVMVRDARKPK